MPTVGTVITDTTRPKVWRINLLPTVDNDDYLIQIVDTTTVNKKEKVYISSGKTYASKYFWLRNDLQYIPVPEITAIKDYIFYQDGTDSNYTGQIKLVNNLTSTIDVDTDIIGKVGYTSPNGITFTNGLKIQFDSSVVPSSYANNQYYIEGVGKSMSLVPVSELLPVESYASNIESTPDYITINRASIDRNPWSRYNRWFHIDIINAVANYNNTVADYGPNIPGRRPIIEFDANLQLFNTGKVAKRPVNYVNLSTNGAIDAFNDIEGMITADIDGVALQTGDRVLFANDYNLTIRNKVFDVIIEEINAVHYITLVETDDDPVQVGEQVLVTGGVDNAGKTVRYDGTGWTVCQSKTDINQSPLFDLVDSDGYSFGDTTVYHGSTFAGTKLFSYSVGTGDNDKILGFPIKYQTFNNVGDIQFTNYYDTDTFDYTVGLDTTTVRANTGFLIENLDIENNNKYNNWIKTVEDSKQYQLFTQFFDGLVITLEDTVATLPERKLVEAGDYAFVELDILPDTQESVPYLKVYLNNALLNPETDYRIVKIGIYNVLILVSMPTVGDKIDVAIYNSSDVSTSGYYQIPDNLEFNPLNESVDAVTLGQIRSHYNKLLENTSAYSKGIIPIQDMQIRQQGGTLLQHRSPAIYAMTFLNHKDLNFVDAITLSKKEYSKFKNKFLSLCNTLSNLTYSDPITGVDIIMNNINAVKNSSFPWYYSDMIPANGDFNSINYTVLNVRQKNYEISSFFDSTALSNRAVLVWLNGKQLRHGVDYEFSPNSPAIAFAIDFDIGDNLLIRDYFNTDGNYVPETPTKLGLYPKFVPEKYLDNTYQTPIYVIRGHDGSITPAFGDFRDDYLLELELRIYNNIKANYDNNVLKLSDIVPGRFRTTDYSMTEFTQTLAQSLLAWAGSNNVDYTDNSYYEPSNSWTWNYGKFTDVVDGSFLQGSWRAVYQYWFDTTTPNISPWEMLGFGGKPTWWDTRYGPSPYTSGNAVLWEDLEAGYIWNNGDAYIDNRYSRPGLTTFIPVDTAGNLLSPDQIQLIKQANPTTSGEKFQAGQQSPVEVAWRKSSDYPYALQLALALCRPAEYFSTQIDISKFYTNPYTGHFSTLDNEKLNPLTIVVNGDTTNGNVSRAAGYLNWVADRIKNLGIDPVTKINNILSKMSVQLGYKVGGFTDKNLITVYAEQTTPATTNASVIIPDSNYHVFLDKSLPVVKITYSAVIVTRTATGYYSVAGYDTYNPYFKILPSVVDAKTTDVSINDATVKLYQNYSKTLTLIPYGTEFTSTQQVSDFLISYERYLASQGIAFVQFDSDLNQQRNWTLSVKEFMSWSQQGWAENSSIVLNPIADKLSLASFNSVIDEISNLPNGNRLLDQNFSPIKNNNFNLVRVSDPTAVNQFQITTLDGSSICFAQLNAVQLEHTLVFDNVSDFGDIFYIPNLGTRQSRLRIDGHKSALWAGTLSAPGYVYNSGTFADWQTGKDYKVGDIVKHNNFYYTALVNIPASQTFDLSKWIYSNPADIKTGLLPNFSRNSRIFENIYDVDAPPSNETLQAYSAGLIGFRQRPYLTDLGISVPTQTKFYQGFIKEKGTFNAINALTTAEFNNVTGNININEEWAFKVGTYGGVDTTTFKEFVLDQSVFTSNPVSFTLTDTYSTGNIIANLILANVHNASNVVSTVTSLYSNRAVDTHITDLPSCGYVNLNDATHTIFDLSQFTDSVSTYGSGDNVWTAKNSVGQWDILRVNERDINATQFTYTLNDYAQIKFDNKHNLQVNDSLIIKNFDPDFDGIYQVVKVPTSLTVTVKLTNVTAIQRLVRGLTLNGTGIVYSLDSVQFNTVTDLINNPIPKHGWVENDHAWVNNDGDDKWAVYSFNLPWRSNAVSDITANTVVSNNRFASAVNLSSDNQYIYIGNPGNQSVQVFANVGGTYHASTTLSNVNANFGTTIESQGNLLVVGSYTDANVHIYRNNNGTITKLQTIKSANVSTITSLSLSSDLAWLYVGDATTNKVEVYHSSNATTYTWANAIAGIASTQFGNVVKTNSDGTKLFVGAPLATTTYANDGKVFVYNWFTNNSTYALTQTISSQYKNQFARFGYSLDIDATASNLYVGIPDSNETGYPNGALEHHTLISGTYQHNQTIGQPTSDIGEFGVAVSVSSDAKILAVGSRGSATDEHTYFDNRTTIIDSDTTKFIDEIYNSGVAYIFERLVDNTLTQDPGKYLFVQELETDTGLAGGDRFGDTVDVSRGIIVVGAPGKNASSGKAYIFHNNNQVAGWSVSRHQQPKVELASISRTFIYNQKNNNILAALDYLDPAKGKVLNIADKDIDFKLATDPALYNQGTGMTSADLHWGPVQVGKIWWDLNTVRYIDYEQDSLIYRLNHWGQRFPGSTINVYEWVESTVLPSQYPGPGIPKHPDDSAYATRGYVDSTGNIKLKYYFWVEGKDTINTRAGKSNSIVGIVNAIESPEVQGTSYISVLRADTVSLFNVNHLLTGTNSVLHLGTQEDDSLIVHSEYTLVQEGNPASKIPTSLTNKLNDSLSGLDAVGNPVPDPALPVSQRYGISIRPRQSMVVNRQDALANVITIINNFLKHYPICSRKSLTGMNSSEPIPDADSGEYNSSITPLASIEELSYVNTNNLAVGTKVLVLSDATQLTKWSIYTFNGVDFGTEPTRVQSYKTNLYWSYSDWYSSSYDSTTTPNVTVQTNLDLGKLTLSPDTYIKVLDNGYGKFVVYYVDSILNLQLVGIESGTIQIGADFFPPALETRQMLIAMHDEIFIDDIAEEYNKIFFTLMKYILSEQKNIDWMFKTSFISATQHIRKLEQFPAYIADNQDFYLDYINEVKPYRTVVREFVVDYEKNDYFNGDITDFDLPPYWDSSLGIYRSPSGEQPYDSTTVKSGVYSQWYKNYTYKVVDVLIERGGSNYTIAPQITFIGGGGTGAAGYATINGFGQLSSIVITNPGSGYTTIPTIIINGTGSGAQARAVLRNVYDNSNVGHNVVRSIKTTMKFDRISYTNSNVFQHWSTVTSGQVIAGNTIIVLNGLLYKLDTTDYTVTSNLEFPVANVTQINSASFNEANDRIVAFNGNIDLGMYVDGIDYPGVVVDGNTATLWTANLLLPTDSLVNYQGNLYTVTGNVYDAGGTFGNISSNVTLTTADSLTDVGSGTDSIITSRYTDVLGISPSDIDIDGGAYVDTYSSHAPEELLPGRMYDTLSISVFSNTAPDVNDYAFRVFDNLNQQHQFYRINANASTVLAESLHIIDSEIKVIDVTVLPDPNPTLGIPGEVFIGSEKISYYQKFTSNNTIAQIRRSVDGTPINANITSNLSSVRVVDSSLTQTVPNVVFTTANITSNTAFITTANVSLKVILTGNVTANIGDYLVQHFANTTVAANLRVLETTSTNIVPAIVISGNLTELNGNTISINGNTTDHALNTYTTLGSVQANGAVIIAATTSDYVLLETTYDWYSPGISTPADGTGLINSNTIQAKFLLENPGYMP